MAVTQISAYSYVGLAADVKPTAGTITGSKFVETDTGAEFIFDGTAWVETSPKVNTELTAALDIGTVDQGAAGAAAWKVDDDATQILLGEVQASPTANTVLDRLKTLATLLSGGLAAPAIDSYTHLAINLAAAANQVLVAGAANKQIWVYGIGFTLSVAGSVSFQDEDDVAITGIMPFAANSGLAISPSGNFGMPLWKVPTAKALEVDIVTADLDGWLDYAIVSV